MSLKQKHHKGPQLTSFSNFSVDDLYDKQNAVTKEKHENNERGSLSYYKLFRYADKIDYLLIIISAISAAIHGAVVPVIFIVFGDMTNSFVAFGKFEPCAFNYTLCKEMGIIPENTTIRDFTDMVKTALNLNDEITQYTLQYTYLACAVLVFAAIQVSCSMLQALRQTRRIRIDFFRCILRQDISFFDLNSTGELNTRLTDDINRIQEGIGDKASVTLQFACRAVTGVFIGFFYGWQLTLVVLAMTPLIGVGVAAIFMTTNYYTEKELDAYAKAGSIAEEVLSSIRTVFAFGGQEIECKRYDENLRRARKVGIRKGVGTGIGLGFMYMIIYVTYSIAFWYGSRLIFEGVLDPGSMLTTFSGVLIGAMSLGGIGSSIEYFSAAKAAAYKVFEIIDRVPPIDSMSEEGHKPDRVTGRIEFKNVDFTYPSRPDVQVLHGVSFTAESGKSLALCGQSGCGKSTCVQLIQRFYDPENGVVELDGVDVRTLNVKWLREHIGVVSQEPILFDTTIAENIRYGRLDVTDEQIEEATKKSNAYDFIMKLPYKFETMVGEGGAQMSGGQKQRIAIARAIVRDPKVMLLDEATSALDTESEAVVQAALDKASEGRTTIVIAHRLSTIRNADKIIGFHEGRALEAGNHDELLKVENGVYQNLVNMQSYNAEEEIFDKKNNNITARKRIKRTLSEGSCETEDSTVDEEILDDDISNFSIKRVLALNRPELVYIVLGCIAAAINGGIQPVFAIIFSEMLVVFTLTDRNEQEQKIVLYSLGFFAIGVISFLANSVQASSFAKSGEELTSRLRSQGFRAILRQSIGYFDDHLNSTGALTTRLATDASKVQGCTGVQAGVAIQSIFALGCTLVISFVYGWRLTFVTLAFIPMMMIAGIISVNMMTGKSGEVSKAYEEAGQIASEATINMRTVASLGREDKFFTSYNKALDLPYNKSLKKSYIFGLTFGFSQCVMFFAFAATFRYGAWLVTQQLMNFEDIFTCLMAVVFGALAAGQTTSFAPDYAEAKLSAARMFRLFDHVPAIDSYSKEGAQLNTMDGKISYSEVKFNYPTRPDVQVLKGLTAKVLPGQTVALVGQSGCGKSTCIQLLERFYDPVEGDVLLEEKNLKDLQISWFRSKMGIVSQEPVLFDRSIADNIRYGDNTRYADMKEVVAAAKNANIHDFISSLSQAYETNVGAKGTQLSGGQKQRVAIARALLRNPKVLLLDEATSALDAESEKIVQDALDSASQGRTTIIIAHRLSTIKNADVIAVIENGSVVETGSHAELIAMKGSYFSLVNAQLHHKSE